MEALLISTAVIFLAELGDKSQMMSLAFAAKFKTMPVLIGIALATSIVQAISVIVGGVIGASIPTRPVTLLAAISFVLFGLWTLRDSKTEEDDSEPRLTSTRHVILAVSSVFFLAEFGDKTMLATITLATQNGLLGTWLGSTVGMVAANALAIAAGRQLGARLPERTVRIGAAVAFFVFAAVLFVDVL